MTEPDVPSVDGAPATGTASCSPPQRQKKSASRLWKDTVEAARADATRGRPKRASAEAGVRALVQKELDEGDRAGESIQVDGGVKRTKPDDAEEGTTDGEVEPARKRDASKSKSADGLKDAIMDDIYMNVFCQRKTGADKKQVIVCQLCPLDNGGRHRGPMTYAADRQRVERDVRAHFASEGQKHVTSVREVGVKVDVMLQGRVEHKEIVEWAKRWLLSKQQKHKDQGISGHMAKAMTAGQKADVHVRLLAVMLRHNIPFNFVDDLDAKKLLSSDSVKVVGRRQLVRKWLFGLDAIFDFYLAGRIRTTLKGRAGCRTVGIAVTCDAWTSYKMRRAFFPITMQWLNEHGEVEVHVLAFERLRGTHDGEYLSDVLNAHVVRLFELIPEADRDRVYVSCAVTDGASAMMAMGADFFDTSTGTDHLWCSAHLMQRVLCDFYGDGDTEITDKVVSALSEEEMACYNATIASCDTVREAAVEIARLQGLQDDLRTLHKVKKEKVTQDGFVCLVSEARIRFSSRISTMARFMDLNQGDVAALLDEEGQASLPSSDDMDTVRGVLSMLQWVRRLTSIASGSKYNSLAVMTVLVKQLVARLDSCAAGTGMQTTAVRACARVLAGCLRARFGHMLGEKGEASMAICAVFLVPAFSHYVVPDSNEKLKNNVLNMVSEEAATQLVLENPKHSFSQAIDAVRGMVNFALDGMRESWKSNKEYEDVAVRVFDAVCLPNAKGAAAQREQQEKILAQVNAVSHWMGVTHPSQRRFRARRRRRYGTCRVFCTWMAARCSRFVERIAKVSCRWGLFVSCVRRRGACASMAIRRLISMCRASKRGRRGLRCLMWTQ